MSNLEQRIANILRKHYLWDECDGSGHMARCRCDVDKPSITNGVPDGGWMPFDEHFGHVAEVLVSELGLTREARGGTIPFGMATPKFPPSSRYVTEWVADA